MNFHIRATLSSSPKLGNSMNTFNEPNQELKPCPFCGGDAVSSTCTAGDDESGYYALHSVHCRECKSATDDAIGREDAIKIWNTRTDGWISVDDELPEI